MNNGFDWKKPLYWILPGFILSIFVILKIETMENAIGKAPANLISGVCLLILLVCFFSPAIVAHITKREDPGKIFLFTMIFGLSGIGWILAYKRAVGKDDEAEFEEKTEQSSINMAPRMQIDGHSASPKIGGWLIGFILGWIGFILQSITVLQKDNLPIFTNGTWTLLTTPGTEQYNPLWGPLILFEIIGNAALVIFAVVIAYSFFHKKRSLPKMVITLVIANFFFILIDQALSIKMSEDVLKIEQEEIEAQKDDASKVLGRSFLSSVATLLYFTKSKRVEKTFVN